MTQNRAFGSDGKAHLWRVTPQGKSDGVSILRITEGPCTIVMAAFLGGRGQPENQSYPIVPPTGSMEGAAGTPVPLLWKGGWPQDFKGPFPLKESMIKFRMSEQEGPSR